MKNRIIIAAAFTACLALCAAVWTQTEKVEKTPAPSEKTAVTTPRPTLSGSRENGAASGNRKARIGNAGS